MVISSKVLQEISTKDASVLDDHSSRSDSCYLAKQRKLSFLLSVSVTSQLFEIVHVDIWGPLSIATYSSHRYLLWLMITVDVYGCFC